MSKELDAFFDQFCRRNGFVNLFHLSFFPRKEIECFFHIFEEQSIANDTNIVISRFCFENSRIPVLETFLIKSVIGASLAIGSERGGDYVREFMLSFVFSIVQKSECVSRVEWISDQNKFDATRLD